MVQRPLRRSSRPDAVMLQVFLDNAHIHARPIGKLSAFLQLLGLRLRNTTRTRSPSAYVSIRQHTSAYEFPFRRAAFHSQLKSKVGNILAKATALRINLNLDGAPTSARAHTHPSRLLSARFLRYNKRKIYRSSRK